LNLSVHIKAADQAEMTTKANAIAATFYGTAPHQTPVPSYAWATFDEATGELVCFEADYYIQDNSQ
jgi:hypothetical protein